MKVKAVVLRLGSAFRPSVGSGTATWAIGLACLLASGCGSDGGDETAVVGDPLCDQGYVLTWKSWGEGFFATYCDACHAADTPNRFGATEGVTFDTLDEVRDQQDRIRVRVIEQETMPLGGGVFEDDLELLDVFLTCSL